MDGCRPGCLGDREYDGLYLGLEDRFRLGRWNRTPGKGGRSPTRGHSERERRRWTMRGGDPVEVCRTLERVENVWKNLGRLEVKERGVSFVSGSFLDKGKL